MFARTERLLLRPAWDEDAAAILHAINDEGVARNLTRVPWPYCLADAHQFIAMHRGPREPTLLIFRRGEEAPELVGAIGLGAAPCGGAELGYWIARSCWGQGYASEAGEAMIRMARDGLRLDRLVAGHFLDNPASGRVLRKLGFKPTGTIRPRYSLARGHEVPCADFDLDLSENRCDDVSAAACAEMAA